MKLTRFSIRSVVDAGPMGHGGQQQSNGHAGYRTGFGGFHEMQYLRCRIRGRSAFCAGAAVRFQRTVSPAVPVLTNCPKCGTPVRQGAQFCPACGFRLKEPSRAPSSAAPPNLLSRCVSYAPARILRAAAGSVRATADAIWPTAGPYGHQRVTDSSHIRTTPGCVSAVCAARYARQKRSTTVCWQQ
jgi:hypothetical protein